MAESEEIRVVARGEGQMLEFAAQLAPTTGAGDLLLLRGDLGAGKTTLTRGIVRALGSPAAVSSPTFSLIHVYEGGSVTVVHVDAYRLTGPADLLSIGLDDYLAAADSLVIVEWPERIEAALPAERIEIAIEETDDESRELCISARGERWRPALDALRKTFAEC